jgi:hypothetical protein
LSKSEVLSYDSAATDALVRDLYAELARTADGDLPLVTGLVDDPRWKALVEAVTTLDGRLTHDEDRVLRGMRDVGRHFGLFRTGGLKFGSPTADLLATLQLFHTPPLKPAPVTERQRTDDPRIDGTWMEYEHNDMPAREELTKKIDFHQVVAAMNSYPTLLRNLGLVVDLVIDRSACAVAHDGRFPLGCA